MEEKSHRTDFQYQCKECKESFFNVISLQCHQAVHSVREHSSNSFNILDTEADNHLNNVYKSTECQETFVNAPSLQNHKVFHSVCKQTSNFKATNNAAIRDENNGFKSRPKSTNFNEGDVPDNDEEIDKDRNFSMSYKSVEKSLSSARDPSCEETMTPHKNAQNDDDQSHDLKNVGSEFYQQAHLKTIKGKRIIKCELCEKQFHNKSNLNRHKKSHTGEKPYECEICGKHFARSSVLKTHLITHSLDKPFVCGACGKSFSIKSDLLRHVVTHTGEKPFKCEVCGNTFSQGGSLTIHMRIHSGEKPYSCDVCGKSFISRRELQRHIRVHTGEKPFKCEFCGKFFSQSGHLKSHKKRHTRSTEVSSK